ncbi:MAG: ORF6N domain-containing protein [Bryobacteraceae bacterium]
MENCICLLRGQKVILDSDLAALYGVETKVFNQSVRRNAARFPEDFMFQLTTDEATSLRSQFVTLDTTGRGRHSKYAPLAFTEHGVAMLSAVLRSERAVQVSINIVRAFVRMRELVAANKELAQRIATLERNQKTTASVIEMIAQDIAQLDKEIKQMKALPPASRRRIGFKA